MRTMRWSLLPLLSLLLSAPVVPATLDTANAAEEHTRLGAAFFSRAETTPEGRARTRLDLLVEWTPDSLVRFGASVLLRDAVLFEPGEPLDVLVGVAGRPYEITGIRRSNDPTRKVYPTEMAGYGVSGMPQAVAGKIRKTSAEGVLDAGMTPSDADQRPAPRVTVAPVTPRAPVPDSPPVPDPTCGSTDARPPASCLMAFADLDGDAIRDLVLVRHDGAKIYVLLGDGRGGFLSAREVSSEFKPRCVAVGDLDGDHLPDLALADPSRGVSIMTGDGRGGFQPSARIAMSGSPRLVVVAPLLGGERSDLVVAICGTEGEKSIAVYSAGESGEFAQKRSIAAESRFDALFVDDLDRDGKLDLIELSVGEGTAKPHLGVHLQRP